MNAPLVYNVPSAEDAGVKQEHFSISKTVPESEVEYVKQQTYDAITSYIMGPPERRLALAAPGQIAAQSNGVVNMSSVGPVQGSWAYSLGINTEDDLWTMITGAICVIGLVLFAACCGYILYRKRNRSSQTSFSLFRFGSIKQQMIITNGEVEEAEEGEEDDESSVADIFEQDSHVRHRGKKGHRPSRRAK
jgi:hypothetical protein